MSEFKRTVNNRLTKVEDYIREYNIVSYPEIKKDLIILAKDSKALKELVNNNFKFMREYNKAINFLNWFDFNMLVSEKLAKEAFNKKYVELPSIDIPFESGLFINFDINALQEAEKDNTITNFISRGGLNNHCFVVDAGATDISICNTPTRDFSLYDTIQVGDITIKRSTNKPKVKYEEKVGCVWERPFDYNESTVISVYKYLKGIYDTSKTISKYKDKYNY